MTERRHDEMTTTNSVYNAGLIKSDTIRRVVHLFFCSDGIYEAIALIFAQSFFIEDEPDCNSASL